MTEDVRPRQDDGDASTVAAVIVVRNGSRWLAELIASVARMEVSPDYWHVIDVASTDESAAMVRSAFGECVSFVASGTGFGAAVAEAVKQLPDADWLWLLHDDMTVSHQMLAELLDEASQAGDIAAVGPKIREWPSLRRLLEVGLTITGTAQRETGLEPGEPDDGQHDRAQDVLAAGSAGILIRRSVWRELDGFDPDLPLFFDDIDFGWRANNAGHRVRVAPRASCFHVEASARGARTVASGDVAADEERRAGLYTALVNAPRAGFWWQYVRLFCGTVLRILGFLVVKAPADARDELTALARVYRRPRRLLRARRMRARPSAADARRVRSLRPSPWLPYVRGFEAVATVLRGYLRPETVVSQGRRSTGADAAYQPRQPAGRRAHPWLITIAVLVLLSLIAGRSLFSAGSLQGGALPPSPATAGDWWSLFFAGWHDVSIGSHAAGPAFALLLALVATPVWFAPGTVTIIIVIFGVPLAAITAHRFARMLSGRRPVQLAWSLTYAAAVVASGAVAQGRIGTLVALIVLPILARAFVRLAAGPTWRTGLLLGLWTAVATAFAPIVYTVVVIVLIGCACGYGTRRWRAGNWGSAVLAIAVPWALLGPWMFQRVLHPARVWWEAGLPVPGSGDAMDIAFGRGGGPGSAPWWLSIGLLVLAVLALFPARSRRTVALAWLIALLGLALSTWGMTAEFSTVSSALRHSAWTGLPAVLWVAGLSAAAALAAEQWAGVSRQRLIALTVLAAMLPAGTAVWWIVRGSDEPLARSESDRVPIYVAEQPGSALVISGGVASGINVGVVNGSGPTLGQESVMPPERRFEPIKASVRKTLADPGSAGMPGLSDYGITAVYAPHADQRIARSLDAEAGLSPAGSDKSGSRVWRVKNADSSHGARAAGQHDRRTSNTVVAGAQTLAWIVIVVLVLPSRPTGRNGGA